MRPQNARLVIIQPIIPHYRIALFQALSQDPKLQAIIVCGDSVKNLDSVPTPSTIRRYNLRNHWIFKRFRFQLVPIWVYSSHIIIIEFDTSILSNYPLILWRIISRRPFIFWGHGIGLGIDRRLWVTPLNQWLAHMAGALIFYSEKARTACIAQGIDPEKLFVAPNSIDIDEIWTTKANLQQPTRDQIIFIGRLIPAKKVDLLLESFIDIADQIQSNIGLTIIGNGPEYESLKKKASSSHVPNRITFTGELTQQKNIAPYMLRGLISVSPGYVGLAAIHSQAYGVPMLVSQDEPNSPEVDSIEQGVTGEFFSPSTSGALSRALLNLLKSPDKLQRMSKAAERNIHEKYNTQNMVKAFQQACHYVVRESHQEMI